jgi:ribosomal protein L7/L12
MNELLVPVLIVAAIAGVFVALIGARIGSVEQRLRALSRVEGKLDALLKQQGIRFDPYGDTPPAVLDALRRGKTIEAIKEYRAATGGGLKEAKEYVDELRRRASRNV